MFDWDDFVDIVSSAPKFDGNDDNCGPRLDGCDKLFVWMFPKEVWSDAV